MSASEVRYLIINALITLGLLGNRFYDEDSGNWYIKIPAQSYRYGFTKG